MTPAQSRAEKLQTTSLTRRAALALLSAFCPKVVRAFVPDSSAPLRIAISESMVVDVNLNDARAAMQTWIQRMQADLKVSIEIDPRVFSTPDEVVHGIRTGRLDAAALNVIEYRPISDQFDTHQFLVGAGGAGPDEYLLLVRKDSPYQQLANLRGRRLVVLKAAKMCVAPAWLATLLADAKLGPADAFFGSMVSDTKLSRVVLPVFFQQAEVCLTSKRGFETMCELNPQVAKSLAVIARSPVLVTCFYGFRKSYPSAARARFLDVHKTLLSSPSGRQLATLFQFDEMNISDAGCLTDSLAILDKVEKIRAVSGGRKG